MFIFILLNSKDTNSKDMCLSVKFSLTTAPIQFLGNLHFGHRPVIGFFLFLNLILNSFFPRSLGYWKMLVRIKLVVLIKLTL